MGVDVRIHKSFLNRNYNGSIFGGTIFSATDPFFALLFDQIFQRKGFKTVVWLKSASIQYVKPGKTNLYFEIRISPDDIVEVEQQLRLHGKYTKTFPISVKDRYGEVCAMAHNEIYIKDKLYQRSAKDSKQTP